MSFNILMAFLMFKGYCRVGYQHEGGSVLGAVDRQRTCDKRVIAAF